jgi:hypothetical protein
MLTKKKSIGYPLEYLMELDGMDPVEVVRVLAMVEQERNDPQLAAAMRGLDGSSGGGGAVPGAAASGGNDSGGNAPPVAPPGS